MLLLQNRTSFSIQVADQEIMEALIHIIFFFQFYLLSFIPPFCSLISYVFRIFCLVHLAFSLSFAKSLFFMGFSFSYKVYGFRIVSQFCRDSTKPSVFFHMKVRRKSEHKFIILGLNSFNFFLIILFLFYISTILFY